MYFAVITITCQNVWSIQAALFRDGCLLDVVSAALVSAALMCCARLDTRALECSSVLTPCSNVHSMIYTCPENLHACTIQMFTHTQTQYMHICIDVRAS
jgi:hypothetical protein